MPLTIPSSVRSHRYLSLWECLCDPVEAVKQIYYSVKSAYFIGTIASDHLQTIAADTVRGMFNSYNSIIYTMHIDSSGMVTSSDVTRLTREAKDRYGDALATFAYNRLMSMEYDDATFTEWFQPFIAPLKFMGALVTGCLVSIAAALIHHKAFEVEESADETFMFNNTAQVCPLLVEKSANENLSFDNDAHTSRENGGGVTSSLLVCDMQMDFSFLEMCPADVSPHEKSVALAGSDGKDGG